MELMAIPGKSGEEGRVVEFIKSKLRSAGVPTLAIRTDNANKHIPFGGEVGNLIVQLAGSSNAPRRLLMAHMDTVPICVGSKPVRDGDFVHSSDSTTGLGADDRAGCAVVLNTLLEIVERKLPHPPLTFFWPVQEEVGLYGARYVQMNLLGKPKLAFNWDGGRGRENHDRGNRRLSTFDHDRRSGQPCRRCSRAWRQRHCYRIVGHRRSG